MRAAGDCAGHVSLAWLRGGHRPRILRLLLADGRMSYTDLGKATGLSTSAVHQRVRRLEQRGVIQGYRAVVDPRRSACR